MFRHKKRKWKCIGKVLFGIGIFFLLLCVCPGINSKMKEISVGNVKLDQTPMHYVFEAADRIHEKSSAWNGPGRKTVGKAMLADKAISESHVVQDKDTDIRLSALLHDVKRQDIGSFASGIATSALEALNKLYNLTESAEDGFNQLMEPNIQLEGKGYIRQFMDYCNENFGKNAK